MYSQIVNLIKTNPNWRKELEDLHISVKEDEYGYAIFNYDDLTADFTNPIVREARGIIINLDECQVVCWPFTSFRNPDEPGAQIDLRNFDWNDCRVEEKIDGSIVKLWWRDGAGWVWSSNSCIDAFEAPINGADKSFGQIIREAVNFKDISFEQLLPAYTYIFELVSPETQVVIRYPQPKLYHIGTRCNLNGRETRVDIGMPRPRVFDLHSLDDCVKAANELNDSTGEVKAEGFVVVDKNWHRVKVKSPRYVFIHRFIGNGLTKKAFVSMMREGISYEDFCKTFPWLEVEFLYYQYKTKELEWEVQQFMDYSRGLFEEYNQNRKALAETIKSKKFSKYGFKGIGSTCTAKELLDETALSSYCKMIPDYERGDWLQ